jgi:hypothetical protein
LRAAAMSDVLERGSVYFFYRPRVEQHAPRGEDDVQRFLVVLAPEERRLLRLLQVGAKRLPYAAGRSRERNWAWVKRVVGAPEELEDELRGYRYTTRTRGERDQPAARPVGEGSYALVRHGDHTHLAYALSRPAAPGPVQQELGIRGTGSVIAVVLNPEERLGVERVGLDAEATAFYPREMQERFRGRRFGELEPAHLDREGAELVLIGTDEEPEAELGIRLARNEEPDVYRALGLERAAHPVKPLFTGEWA